MTKQEAAIKYITENYLDFNALRHDVIADRLQVRCAHSLGDEANRLLGDEARGDEARGERLEAKGKEYWKELTKHDINSIVCHCAQEYDANITSREVLTALQSDLIPDVHPLREYILSLRPYTTDQPDWIDFVARQVHVKNNDTENKIQQPKQLDLTTYSARNNTASGTEEYTYQQLETSNKNNSLPLGCVLISPKGSNDHSVYVPQRNVVENNVVDVVVNNNPADTLWRTCFKKWFVAMVASWMKDDIVNHQVLVLIGRQGIYKTTWLEHLIPPHLRAYACKLANSADLNKDERLRIAEFGLISLDEIDSMNNRELNQLKSVITATDVNERAAYAYTKERRVRLASFCASGNRRDFLTDITGNRRWLPFEVESIQNPFYTTLPYDLMYAQAWALAQDPTFNYWFELDEIEVLEKHNQHFRDESNEEQLLPILFDVPAEGKGEFMTTAQISERLVTYGNIKKPMAIGRLGVLLGQKGYRSVTRGSKQSRIRGWIVYQRDTQEITANKKLLAKEGVTV